ncbi:uncharacterized protein F54H12.2 [Caerostris darwini]|uniref:Uncharacterized protein F54H12.2 n=1 Tax=Caerostris darwini TaxID=1538125 RepID=A0AAV4QN25_9ARAC|nr:uncharacterized protein F54H12.2 [Caerostris darwini]
MKIKLIRSKPEFCLQGNAGYKIVLEKLNLLVRKVRVSPSVILGHAKDLENGTAKYPLNRVLCKVYSVPQGSMSFVQDNIFVGQMPKRNIVGCIDNDAFHNESSTIPGSHGYFYYENGCPEFFDSFEIQNLIFMIHDFMKSDFTLPFCMLEFDSSTKSYF